MTTPDNIIELQQNEVFVFGSNFDGRHGAGAAKAARERFGAINGIPMGLMRQSYGIVTTDISNPNPYSNDRAKMLLFIQSQLQVLYMFAETRRDLTFYVTKIGCGLGGFSEYEIRLVFNEVEFQRPANVILPWLI